jgi:hypothetical protein
LLWIAEILRWVKPRLPDGYRAYVGTWPLVAVSAPEGQPDLQVRSTHPVPANGISRQGQNQKTPREPDAEVAVGTLESAEASVIVERNGRMVATVELVSPGNKDRPSRRADYTARYAGYLRQGVHLLLVDVIPSSPRGFSFADAILEQFDVRDQPACPAPFAYTFRVGEPAATGGSILGLWRRPLEVGQPLATLPVPLTVHDEVMLDLESTYMRAAADAYLT